MNLIAFSRGARGWLALNNATTPKTVTVQTGMAPGTYCDIVHGTTSGGACSGPTVAVDAQGRAHVTVPAKDAVAFTRSDRI